ncbi:ABC transporter permease [Acidimangrovimonas sediminis]|uniref:ABC transporter permease n=1 Tax=Acidimangrovimonas sediminis TaxID=2056283 RepID=UPI000C80ED7E|nr:ABC transporter permease [Acidimangrovimonas sediminis]
MSVAPARAARRLSLPPSAYGFIAAALLWGGTMLLSDGRGGIEMLSVALSFSIFSVAVGTGQMFVIASGPGNIDLSCPAVITLCAYVSMNLMGGADGMLPVGLIAALVLGGVIGLVNYGLVRALKIPPIIATLAASFVVTSLAMWYGGESTVRPPQALSDFMIWRVGGVQVALILALIGSGVVHLVLHRTVYGRSLLALGQNARAAQLAGIRVGFVRMTAYAVSGMMAGLCGFLLAGFTGGAALNMGEAYLMESVAVAVLGGTSVAGGRASAFGIWGAALFLSLLVTLLNSTGLGAGARYLFTGLTILVVIFFATERRK